MTDATTFTAKMGSGTTPTFEKKYLSEVNEKEQLIETFGGLRHRIIAALTKSGYEIEFERTMFPELKPYVQALSQDDLENLSDRNDQIHVLGLICDHPEGFVVKAPTGWGKSYLIVQVCKMLPHNRIAVVLPGKEILRTVYRRVKSQVRDVGVVGDGHNYISRITLCTMESLHKLQGMEWDLLLFDEVHRAASPVTANNLAEIFFNTKCVGLSASPTGRSDGADLVTEALFGPILYTVSYQEGVDRGAVTPIEVRMYQIDIGPDIDSSNSAAINATGIWRNEIRNAFIAKLARQIPEDEQTLITVATAEHALLLRQHLPEFEVVFSNATSRKAKKLLFNPDKTMTVKGVYKGQMMDGYREKLRRDFETGTIKKAIATGVWNTGVDFVGLQWLIRADGMGSDIQSTQTPGRLSRTNDGKHRGILIDFMDAFNPTLYRRSLQRRRAYRHKDKGWKVDMCYDDSVSRQTFSQIKQQEKLHGKNS